MRADDALGLLLRSATPPGGTPPEIDWTAVDWGRVRRLAAWHGMAPLVHRHLAEEDWDGVPPAERSWLEEEHERNRRLVRLITLDLLMILDRLEEAGIEALPFKGPIVAQAAYGDISLRTFVDLDLLVPEDEVAAAREVLAGLGYRPFLVMSPRMETEYLRHRTEYPMERPGARWQADLHWRVFPREFAFPFVPVRGRLATLEIAGRPVRTFGREDRIVLLVAHGAKHLWERLEWIAAVGRLLADPGLDWGALRSRASALGGRRMLDVGILLATDLTGAPVDPAASEAARADRRAGRLAEGVAAWLRGSSARPSAWTRAGFHLGMRERVQDRARVAWRTATVPNLADWRMLDLPPRLAGLYRLLRPFRLAVRWGPRSGRGAGDA